MANGGNHPYCLLALGTSSTTNGIDANGASKANLNGCSIMSDSNATCNGHDLGATYGDAAGPKNDCGKTSRSNVPKVVDPYASWASYIPVNPCGSTYYMEPVKKKDPPPEHPSV
jgi:hypothetical protein